MPCLEPRPRGPPLVMKDGWLLKRSDGHKRAASVGNASKHWNRRYFRIAEGTLSYAKEPGSGSASPQWSFALDDCAVRAGATPAEFVLVARERELALCAATSAEAAVWMDALLAAGAERSADERAPRLPTVGERRLCECVAATLAQPVEWSSPCHRQALEKIWHGLGLGCAGGHSFAQGSDAWKLAGFQQRDPCSDFRSTGTAGLGFLLWCAETAPEPSIASIVRQQRLRDESLGARGLPWAVASINCVRAVSELLEIVAPSNVPGDFAQCRSSCWPLLQSMNGFCELVWAALECLEREFEACGSSYMDFGGCMSRVRKRLASVVGRGSTVPIGSTCELRHALRLPSSKLLGAPDSESEPEAPPLEPTASSSSSGSSFYSSASGGSGRNSLLAKIIPGVRLPHCVGRFSRERSSCPRTLVLGSTDTRSVHEPRLPGVLHSALC